MPSASKAAADGLTVEVILDGTRCRFSLTEAGETELAAVRRAGLDLPEGCTAGMRCTCCSKVIEGEVIEGEVIENYSLQPCDLLECPHRGMSTSFDSLRSRPDRRYAAKF